MTEGVAQEQLINAVSKGIHNTALDKGFWTPPPPHIAEVNTKLMLIVSEVAEAMEVIRQPYDDSPERPYTRMTADQEQDFLFELIDIIIRTFDLAEYLFGGSVAQALLRKMDRNQARPKMHGKRF